MLKIGVHSPFDPNFDVGISTSYPEKFRQAYCIPLVWMAFDISKHLAYGGAWDNPGKIQKKIVDVGPE